MNISIAIPTLGRDSVLVDTIRELLLLNKKAREILIIDQSDYHDDSTLSHLNHWHQRGDIRWIRIQYKSITNAMNIALRKALSDRVLFLDDDIIPDKYLIDIHEEYAYKAPSAIVAGRVLQPWHHGKEDSGEEPFLFNSLKEREVDAFMGGNVSIPRLEAIRIGGFDTNFIRVAYHFEAEFAYRWKNHGNLIFYAPKALIHHLKTERGGTRSYGNHLTTVRPDHTVGRHYFYLCRYPLKKAFLRSLQDVGKSILTKHHLKNPLWIPSTLTSELTGLIWAIILNNSGKGRMQHKETNLLILASHPIQYFSPIFSSLDKSDKFKTTVLYLSLPDSRSQSLGFNHSFSWDIPLLDNYNYRVVETPRGKGLFAGFFGVRIKRPWHEISQIKTNEKPDAALVTGWHFWGMVQMFIAIKVCNIPIILRMDSNALRPRNFILRYVYGIFFSWIDICLCVGTHNQKFCQDSGIDNSRIIRSPHVINNKFFSVNSQLAKQDFANLRKQWDIPQEAFCFLYAGKLQDKKRPLDLLVALQKACYLTSYPIHLLIVGSGSLENECKTFTQIHKLPVSFVGFLNQTGMPKAYAVSNCIVLPSDQGETWGLVINEAMACGLPAITSDLVGCAPDLISDGFTGFSYTCGDSDTLAKYLVYMAENEDQAREMGNNAQKLINSEYTLEKVVASIELAMARING